MPAPPVTIYVGVEVTSLTSTPKVRGHIELLHRGLRGLEIPYEAFDLAVDEEAKRRWQRAKPSQPVVGLPGYLVGGEWIGTMDDFEAAVEEQRLEAFLKQDLEHADPNQSIGDAELERLMKEMSDKDLDNLAGQLDDKPKGGGLGSGAGVVAGAAAGVAAGAAAAGAAAAGAATKLKDAASVDTAASDLKDVTSSAKTETKDTTTKDKDVAAKPTTTTTPYELDPESKAIDSVVPRDISKAESRAEPSSTPAIQDAALEELLAEGPSRAFARTPTEEMHSRAAALAAADAALREMEEDQDDYNEPDERAKDAKAKPSSSSKEPAALHPVEKETKEVDEPKAAEPYYAKKYTDADIKMAADEATSKATIAHVRASIHSPAPDAAKYDDADVQAAADEAASKSSIRTARQGAGTPVPSDKASTTILGAAGAAIASAAGAVAHAAESAVHAAESAAESAVSAVADVPAAAEKFADEASGIDAESAKPEPKVDGPAPGEKTLDEVIDETLAKEKKEEEKKEAKAA